MVGPALLIVDPQNDFHCGGSLEVCGAEADSIRIAKFIKLHRQDLEDIYVTLDSHHPYDISHSCFWRDAKGSSPAPFSTITAADLKSGKWVPANDQLQEHCIKYCETLEAGHRFTHTIWPDHCLIGSRGHAVQGDISLMLQKWGRSQKKIVQFIRKGENPLTEHFSAFKAEMPLEDDPSTHLNQDLINKLQRHSRVIICGQALSHCVNYTTRDLAQHWPADRLADLIIVKDGSSSVTGFEAAGEKFLKDCVDMGLTVVDHFESLRPLEWRAASDANRASL